MINKTVFVSRFPYLKLLNNDLMFTFYTNVFFLFTDDTLLRCPSCDKIFIVEATWRKHCRQCRDGTRWSCEKCGKNYAYKAGLVLHQKYACGKKPGFKCFFCQKRCLQPGNLTKHMVRVHNYKK